MAGRIPPEFIDELLTRTDIVDLVGTRIQLRKAGKDYQARCPFHDEKTPSFTVSPDKQFYHCFGCGAHGTAIGFLMEYDRLDFREAVDELAQRVGLTVPGATETGPAGPDHGPLYALHEQAAELYREQLRIHPDGRRAVDYLKGRGLTGEVAAHYGLGFAPADGRLLLSRLGASPSERERLLSCGLIYDEEGRRRDRFRDRIMFPIRDRRGRVIGFGGRLLGEGKPKYLNSPETPIFHKGRELYGLFEAQKANRKLDVVLVVEGYMDVIALAQFGVTNVVATLGTATTSEHLQLLSRTTPEIVFCFDGDRAGRAAAWKALESALPSATGRQSIRFLFLPDGEDPDTLMRAEGADAFRGRMTQAQPLSEFLFEQLCNQVDMSSIDGRARFSILAQPLIQAVPPGIYHDMLADRMAALAGLPMSPRRPVRRARTPTAHPTRPSLVAQAIALLLDHPELAAEVVDAPDDWRRSPSPGVAILAQLLETIAAHPTISKGGLVERWRDREHFVYLQRLSVAPFLQGIPPDGVAAEFIGALTRIGEDVLKEERRRPLTEPRTVVAGQGVAREGDRAQPEEEVGARTGGHRLE
ncbi:DNA primase [Thiocapsa bogorovii]|uniref:DNA primase n=1 Tax=Thiocapsa bogorovii TaxID=521689 RepID=UPI001E3658ED|nr:DNA primase [Thiocapsa bogorovii]UHD17153.1 DNA primase [Thiocapsa bogorovii]